MTVDTNLLTRIALSLGSRLEEARVQAAREPAAGTLVIEFRVPGETLQLLLSISGHLPRLYLTQQKWPNAPTPPKFLSRFRKNCIGTRLTELEMDEDTLKFCLRRNNATEESYVITFSMDSRHASITLSSSAGWEEVIRPHGPQIHCKPPPIESLSEAEELHEYLEEYYERQLTGATLDNRKSEVSKDVRAALKKARRLVRKITEDQQRAETGGLQMKWGELLKPIANQIKSGQVEVTVVDYHSPELQEVTVPLEPALNGLENMHKYFHRGRRYKAATERIHQRLTDARKHVEQLEALSREIEEARDAASLEELLRGRLPRRRKQQQREPKGTKRRGNEVKLQPYREYRSQRGSRILMGRNAAANDRLTFGVGRSNDLWLHARGRRGAHGLIPRRDKKEISFDCVRDAARLCAFFSEGGKTDSHIEIWVVERKHLRKPKGAPAGTVTYSGGKSVWVKHDEEATRALLNTLAEE